MIRALILFFSLLVTAPTFAQTDLVAQAEIRHLRELIAANDRLYLQQFESQKQAVSAALAAAKEATSRSDTSNEKRLDSQNEFRGQLKDQAATFVTRAELWGYFIGSIGVIGVLFGILFRLLGTRKDVS